MFLTFYSVDLQETNSCRLFNTLNPGATLVLASFANKVYPLIEVYNVFEQ